jgi:hypothetical protein
MNGAFEGPYLELSAYSFPADDHNRSAIAGKQLLKVSSLSTG